MKRKMPTKASYGPYEFGRHIFVLTFRFVIKKISRKGHVLTEQKILSQVFI